ncbi:retrovirus-related pol polyprotein from transposon TNT 1-94 [Tanacetum coccineum]
MSALNQQTLTDSGANDGPPMLEKGNYIPWESRFRRFLDNKLEYRERMWCSIQKGPYVRPMIPDPDDTTKLTTLVNIMDHNNVHPISVSINTKFLNCLQPEWRKYVTMASKAKRVARNHDPLALIAHSNASSQSHASSSYLNFPQPYYVAHPLSVKFSTHTNNCLRTSSKTRNQDVIQDGKVDIQTKNVGYGRNYNRNAGRKNRNQAFNEGNVNDESNKIVQRVPRTKSNPGKENVQCYNCNEKGHYARDFQKPRVRDAKYLREQMLIAMKDEAGRNLNAEENDFMLDNSFRDETLKELTTTVIMMATMTKPTYDAKAFSEVNASHKAHEQVNNVKRKTIIQASDDDQINYNIIFDDPYVENNGGTSEHDSNDHDEYHNIQILAYNVQRAAENQKQLNNEWYRILT